MANIDDFTEIIASSITSYNKPKRPIYRLEWIYSKIEYDDDNECEEITTRKMYAVVEIDESITLKDLVASKRSNEWVWIDGKNTCGVQAFLKPKSPEPLCKELYIVNVMFECNQNLDHLSGNEFCRRGTISKVLLEFIEKIYNDDFIASEPGIIYSERIPNTGGERRASYCFTKVERLA